MRNQEDNRRPEEIEQDIERTRAQLSSNIDAIQSKLTPGEMMDQALSYARTSLPADFGSNLNHAVRENPIPVALIGMGMAWLMMQGKQRPGYMSASRGSVSGVSHRPGSGFADEHGIDFHGQGELDDHGVGGHVTGDHGSGMHNARSRVSETGHNLKSKVSGTSRSLKEKTSSATQGIKEKMSTASHSLRDKASALGERFSSSSSSASESMQGMSQGARTRASELSQRSQQQYSRAKSNFNHMVEEQPMLLGVLGLAIGTLVGALMPATRREDELMGHTRDNLMERGQHLAREQGEKVKSSAQHVAETAQQEARRMVGDHDEQSDRSSTYQKDGAGESTTYGSQSLH